MKNLKDIDISDVSADLSTEEWDVVLKILGEVSDSGSSEVLDGLWEADYEELPVDIRTFITDPRYLGETFVDEDGNVLMYEFWIEFLEKLFAPGSGKFECALSGAIGLGKSTIACAGMAYILHKLLCLRNPAKYYKLTKGSRIGLALFNISLSASYGVGYSKLQSMLKLSPWFLDHGELRGLKDKVYYPGKDIDIVVGSKMEHFIGRDIFCAFLDEMEFAPGSDANMEQSKIMKLYNTVKRRMESRYMQKGGALPGMLFLVSSKRSTNDFLENYIKKNLEKPYLAVVDEPVWVVKACLNRWCGETFPVAVGTKTMKSKILGPDEDIESFRDRGQDVIQVPIEYKEAFELDINSALMDIAGRAIESSSKYFNYDKIQASYRDYLANPWTMEEIYLNFDDDSQLKDFFIPEKLSSVDRSRPHFIHWDTSKTGDATGLSMTTVDGGKPVRRLNGTEVVSTRDIVHRNVFTIKIRAVPGSEIPFFKIREFIFYLREELGFNIASVTCDSYQSVDTIQQFKLRGYNSYTLSVDRSMDAYQALKNAVNEGRYVSPRIETLERDLLNVELNTAMMKVDHTADGEKDSADAVAATILASIKYSKSYDYGESLIQSVLGNDPKSDADSGNWLLDEDEFVIGDTMTIW